MIISIIGGMGSGKTMLATLLAKAYSNIHKNNKIYANYKLNLPNAVYSRFFILPFSLLQNCLLIIDDVYAIQNLKALTLIIANLSRKNDIDIIITAQRDIMIDKTLRVLSHEIFFPTFDKKRNILLVERAKNVKSNEIEREPAFYIANALDKVKNLYETREIVQFSMLNEIINDIQALNDINDKRLNVELIFKNKKEREKILKELNL